MFRDPRGHAVRHAGRREEEGGGILTALRRVKVDAAASQTTRIDCDRRRAVVKNTLNIATHAVDRHDKFADGSLPHSFIPIEDVLALSEGEEGEEESHCRSSIVNVEIAM